MRIDLPGRQSLPMPRANLDNSDLPVAEVNMLANPLVAIATSFPQAAYSSYSTHQPVFFLVSACIANSGILRVERTLLVGGLPVLIENLNQGIALTANALYSFQVPVRSGDKINFRYSVANAVHTLVDGTGTATGSPITKEREPCQRKPH